MSKKQSLSVQTPLVATLLDLLRTASVELSSDVYQSLVKAHNQENWGTRSKSALNLILENLLLAHRMQLPFTSHTSSIGFFVRTPRDFDRIAFEESARYAVTEATRQGLIQSNLVDPVTGKLIKSNAGAGMPQFEYEIDNRETLEVRVILKGNGAEGSGAQFVLPDETLGATNDLAGVRRAVLEALTRNQGRGCGPGVVGIGIGGDRASGMALANRQLLRSVDDNNSVKPLAKLETQLLDEANQLGIGPLGFGGKSTVLGVKIGAEASPIDSCYVSLASVGWAYRRQGVEVSADGEILKWLYRRLSEKNWVDPAKLLPPPPPAKKTEAAPAAPRKARAAVTLPLLGKLEDFAFDEDDLYAPPEPVARAGSASNSKPKKSTAKKSKAKKTATKKTAAAEAKKEDAAPAENSTAKSSAVKKSATKKTAAKKSAAKKTAAKKAPAGKKKTKR